MKLLRYLAALKRYAINPDYRFLVNAGRGLYDNWDDVRYLKRKYRAVFKKDLDLDIPKTFCEKLQWLKLYDRRPEYTRMVDKYEVKKFVAQKIGEEYVIPTLGVWDRFEDIDFASLPDRFVLKCTHDSGGLTICEDKTRFDKKKARLKIMECLNRNYYYHGREWPYKNVRPRIIAEKFMEDSICKELRDYKFFCFDGEPKALFVATERQQADETKFDFFDMDYNHLDIRNGHPNAKQMPQKPQNFEKMKQLASILSDGIPHLRVDFYEVDGKIYFGELTFSHWSGMMPFDPEEWDGIFGGWIKLPKECRCD